MIQLILYRSELKPPLNSCTHFKRYLRRLCPHGIRLFYNNVMHYFVVYTTEQFCAYASIENLNLTVPSKIIYIIITSSPGTTDRHAALMGVRRTKACSTAGNSARHMSRRQAAPSKRAALTSEAPASHGAHGPLVGAYGNVQLRRKR